MRRRTTAAVLVPVLALALGACAALEPTNQENLPDDGSFVGVAEGDWADHGMAAGSVRLAGRLVGLGQGQNVVTSPLGLQLAMSVLAEGATGATALQLEETVGVPRGGSQVVADLRAALVPYAGDASAVDPASPPATPVLDIADVLVVTPGQELLPTFTRRASSYHQARVLEADFAGGTAKATLDAWVTEQTAGALTAMPWDPAPESMMVVLDAVTFAATWEHPFPAATDRPFTFGDGSQLPVRMMSQTLTTAYAADEGWQAVELPYSEGFVLRLALTSDGRAPAWATIDDRLDEAGDSAVEVVLPTWRTDSALSVRPMLRSIGLSAITRPGHLEDMAEAAVISGIGQMVSFSVGELGTMSGSAGAGDGGVTPAASIVLDRAFEYQVVHADTGMVVLAGRLVDPR